MGRSLQVAPSGADALPTTLSERVAAFIHDLRFHDLPPEVVAKAIRLVVHNVGQGLRGSRGDDARQALALATRLSGGVGSTTVIASSRRLQPHDAAFANATMMRAQTMDDVLMPVGVHSGLVTIPGGLALAEDRHLSGRDLITALVAGYEVMGKLGGEVVAASATAGRPITPTVYFGTFGGAVVAAKLLNLDVETTTRALGYAAQQAMGLAESPWTHYYSLVARNGMLSASLAEVGGQTSRRILEADLGFYRTFFGAMPEHLGESIDRLGIEFEIFGATIKRYPGTGLNIVPVELLRDLVIAHHLETSDVIRVDVFVPPSRETSPPPQTYARGPFADHNDAASSLFFQLALVMLDRGKIDHGRYRQYDSLEIASLIQRVHLIAERSADRRWTAAHVRVTTRDGRELSKDAIGYVFPEPDSHSTLLDGGEGVLPIVQLERAAELLDGLELIGDIGDLMACLRPPER